MGRAVLGTLSGIVFLRVLGVSLLLPGFQAYGEALGGSTFATGLAFAAYPLALALLMLPLGALSDRVGRRPVLVGGLAVSALGGVVAAFAPNVLLLGMGRFVQGLGAINGVALAVAGEVGDPARRTRRMAVLGASAGGGFAVGLVLGALLLPFLDIPGLILGFSALNVLMIPLALRTIPAGRPKPSQPASPRGDGTALVLGIGAFAVSFALTGLLFLSASLLEEAAPGARYDVLLLAMALPGGLGMFLAARLADRGHAALVGVVSAALLAVAPLAWLGSWGLTVVVGGGVLFFVGHSSLSSLLPSLAARHAPEGRRGAAQGVQSTLQYLGSAAGSATVAWLAERGQGLAPAFLAAGLVAGAAVLVAARRPSPVR